MIPLDKLADTRLETTDDAIESAMSMLIYRLRGTRRIPCPGTMHGINIDWALDRCADRYVFLSTRKSFQQN